MPIAFDWFTGSPIMGVNQGNRQPPSPPPWDEGEWLWEPKAKVWLPRIQGEQGMNEVMQTKFPNPTPLPVFGSEMKTFFLGGYSHVYAASYKGGKTTAMWPNVHSWAAAGIKVLYLSEEAPRLWAHRSRLLQLDDDPPSNLRMVRALGRPFDFLLWRAANGDEDLVIVDTFNQLLGSYDINSRESVSELARWNGALCQDRSKTLICLGYSLKAKPGTPAGSAKLLGAVDAVINMRRFDEKSPGDTRRLIHVQSRLLDEEHLYQTKKTGNVFTVSTPDIRLSPEEELVVQVLLAGPRTLAEIQGIAGLTRQQARTATQRLKFYKMAKDTPQVDPATGATISTLWELVDVT